MPTSTIIQMSATSTHVLFLCEDGSSWSYEPITKEWSCVLDKNAQLQRSVL